MLTEQQRKNRDGKLTASRVACIMKGDAAEILNLWKELIGDPSYEPADLSTIWAVRLGETTEPLNLEWFVRKHGPISRVGEVVTHSCGWAAATLDAWSDERQCIIECKHCGGRESMETIIERYQPQVHWQMLVTGTHKAALSVIQAANEPVIEFITRDESYAQELWRRAERFMRCVETLTPPVPLPSVSPPVRPTKTYQMQTSNIWCSHAGVWLANKEAAVLAKDAEKELKALVPSDAAKAIGGGVVINRDRAGRLSLREQS